MKTINKPVYQCDYCKKLYQIKSWAQKHEIACSKNPDNYRACFDCVHCSKTKADYYFDGYYGEEHSVVNVLHCDKLKVFIHPPKVERSVLGPFDFGGIDNIPMKKTCSYFKSHLAQYEDDLGL